MPESVAIRCPRCSVKLKLKDRSKIGRVVTCPNCRRSFVAQVPQPEKAAKRADRRASEHGSPKEAPPLPTAAPGRPQAEKKEESAPAPKTPSKSWRKSAIVLGFSVLITVILIGLLIASLNPGVGDSTPDDVPAAASWVDSGVPAAGDGALGTSGGSAPFAASWTQFRGPNRANISHERGLLKSWPAGGPSLLWLRRDLGDGYSTVSVADGMVFTMGNEYGSEMIWALELETGNVLWSQRNGPIYRNEQGDGPRGTPTFEDGNLYSLGGAGDLSCVNAKTGDPVWQKNILSEFEAINIQWGISESVLIDGERLICTPGGRGATMVALNKHDGGLIWKASVPGDPRAAYASPIAVEVGGVRQYVNFTSHSVVGVRAKDGAFLWEERSSANSTANCSTAIFYNSHIFSASGFGVGGALLRLDPAGDGTKATRVYHTREMMNCHGGMVAIDGHLYGSHESMLTCLELRTGRVAWRNYSVGKGSVTCADGHIYLRSEEGSVALIEATPAEYREKGRFEQPQRSGGAAWPHPVVAEGKLFLRDSDLLLCYDVKAKSADQ